MKTTIDLPDDLLIKAKVIAAERRTTLRELVMEGLKRVTDAPAQTQEDQRKATLKRLLKAMQASNNASIKPLTREEIYER